MMWMHNLTFKRVVYFTNCIAIDESYDIDEKIDVIFNSSKYLTIDAFYIKDLRPTTSSAYLSKEDNK